MFRFCSYSFITHYLNWTTKVRKRKIFIWANPIYIHNYRTFLEKLSQLMQKSYENLSHLFIYFFQFISSGLQRIEHMLYNSLEEVNK